MELTAGEFARLLSDLKCDVVPGDRRTNPRAPTRVRASVIAITPDQTAPVKQQVWIRDISRGGFGITSQIAFAEGSRLLILMPKPSGEMFVVLCEVVRLNKVQGGTHLTGTKLLRKLTPEEFAQLMAGTGAMMQALSPPPLAA